jgi:8-oxo-dGTP pyrophosphatase MutT (NUDIX family)
MDALQQFIAPLTTLVTEIYDWPVARFEVNTYLHSIAPPAEFITSVRAVVLRNHTVLVVQDPDGQHILPGGRRERGESYAETAIREVLEETGWQVTIGPLLGCKHFHQVTPATTESFPAQPDFTQLVYVAYAVNYRPEAKEENGYELGAAFVALQQLAQMKITESERLFLQAALAVVQ